MNRTDNHVNWDDVNTRGKNQRAPTTLSQSLFLTKHAADRMQQRGIPEFVIELVLAFGTCEYDSKGGEKYFFDKRSKRRLKSYLGRAIYRALEDYLDIYVVSSDGKIVTCAHRTKRIYRH